MHQRDGDIGARVDALDWRHVGSELDSLGYATAPSLLRPAECRELASDYQTGAFRSTVVMARHGFGQGEYKYFAYPLPATVAALRRALYRRLAPVANRWAAMAGAAGSYPGDYDRYLERCHRAGQVRPTPLLLRYGAGDYNRLHQDLYGELHFPLQATVLLSEPDSDFTGGEFVVTEQRPRRQTRVEVVPLRRGDAVMFAVNRRPVMGTRSTFQVQQRHGVSRVRSGQRYALGIILHDAR